MGMDPVLLVPRRRWPRPALWLDASDASTLTLEDTDRVAGWASRVNTTHDFVVTGDARPTLVADGIGGKPALDFDGTDDYLSLAALPLTSSAGWTIICVSRSDANTATSALYNQSDKDVADRNLYLGRYSSTAPAYVPRLVTNNTAGTSRLGSTGLTADTAFVVTFRSSAAGLVTIFVGSAAETMSSADAGVSQFGDITGADTSSIGALVRNSGSGVEQVGLFNGRVAEIMAWNAWLPDGKCRSVQNYLAGKYGL